MRLFLLNKVGVCREMRFILVDIISFLCYNRIKEMTLKGVYIYDVIRRKRKAGAEGGNDTAC